MADYFRAQADQKSEALRGVYAVCDRISFSNEDLRAAGVSPTEISCVSQYLRDAMMQFETMRNFSRYRTPVTLRAFSRLFLSLFPALFTPYFAFVGYPESPWVGYLVALLYSVVLVGLDNIQELLEDPYDMVGRDDLQLEIADEYLSMLDRDAPAGQRVSVS